MERAGFIEFFGRKKGGNRERPLLDRGRRGFGLAAGAPAGAYDAEEQGREKAKEVFY